MKKPADASRGIDRRTLLAGLGASAALAASTGAAAAASATPAPGAAASPLAETPTAGALPKNVVLFITDQERAIQHFPPGWAERNLPGLTRLARHGLTFENAFTNACMCSPARSTLMTGFFPAQHGVKYTLEESMPADQYPQGELPVDLPNLATVMSAAGFNVVYKGKWHCSKPAGAEWVPADLERYGFGRWNPPDAGANQDIAEGGGGVADNDGRYMHADGEPAAGEEGVLAYLASVAAAQQPFFLIVSLVNPHDVLFYPNTYEEAGYDGSWLTGGIGIPDTNWETLDTKPTVQRQFLALTTAGLGPLPTARMKRDYLNFYANLMKSSDRSLVAVLDQLDALGLTDDTLVIKTADHGEMGLTHGGMRQKNFNVYEEATRVPLVFCNRRLFPTAARSTALVSHVDFLPTLASLFAAPADARAAWQGVDYARLVRNPAGRRTQDYVVFTYDDIQSGQSSGPYPTPPNHIVSLREGRYKLAEYYDAAGEVASQWEMYDLASDPLETHNLAHPGAHRTPRQEQEYRRLRRKLQTIKARRLQPLA